MKNLEKDIRKIKKQICCLKDSIGQNGNTVDASNVFYVDKRYTGLANAILTGTNLLDSTV